MHIRAEHICLCVAEEWVLPLEFFIAQSFLFYCFYLTGTNRFSFKISGAFMNQLSPAVTSSSYLPADVQIATRSLTPRGRVSDGLMSTRFYRIYFYF